VYWLLADDGARFWLDGQLLLDTWDLPASQIQLVRASLEEGSHRFVVEFHDEGGQALIQLSESVERD
jgi:hypothetical protein